MGKRSRCVGIFMRMNKRTVHPPQAPGPAHARHQPTTLAHARPPRSPERPPPNHPSTEPRSTPCHHKEPHGSTLLHEALRLGSQEGSHPKQHHGQIPDEDRKPDTNKRDQHRTRTTPATTRGQTTRLPMRRYFYEFLTEPPCLLDELNCIFNYHSVR